jgi:glycosyltransferase involved in cell wall biosynthesis
VASSVTSVPSLVDVRALLEVSTGAGRQRGLGRYDRAVAETLARLGATVTERTARGTGGPRVAEFLALPEREVRVLRRDFDVFHATTPYAAPLWARRPVITSVHDIIPLDVASHRKTGLKASLFFGLAARSDVVLTLSDYTSGRLVDRLGVDLGRIVVAPLPVAPAFVPDAENAPPLPAQLVGKRYVAALLDHSTADPRKRGGWLVGLAERLAKVDVAVAVTGAGIDAMASVLGLGRVDDDTWATVLRNAELFAYPSAYEGQGLPPLEAISCGTPVLAFANTSLVEVVGEAGLLLTEPPSEQHPAVGPHKPDDAGAALLADACVALLSDPDQLAALAARCAEQAALFSRERFDAGIAEAYSRALSS